MNEAEKWKASQALVDHIRVAKVEEDFYRSKTAEANAELTADLERQAALGGQLCSSQLEHLHYNFDRSKCLYTSICTTDRPTLS